MLNTVSQRIRKIIKSQDQTPQSQFYKSRENSVDSNRSATNSKSNILSMPPKSPNKLPNRESHKSQKLYDNNTNNNKAQHSNNQFEHSHHVRNGEQHGQLYWDEQEIIIRVRDKVVQIIYPLLAEFEKKIESAAGVWKSVQSVVTDLQVGKNQTKTNNSIIYKNLKQLSQKMGIIQTKIAQNIQKQVIKLSEQYLTLSQKLQTTGSSPRSKYQSTNPTSLSTTLPNTPSFIPLKTYENPLNSQIKCKCEKLVEEILKSQNHLMMELKYIKHFQNGNLVNGVAKGGNYMGTRGGRGRGGSESGEFGRFNGFQ